MDNTYKYQKLTIELIKSKLKDIFNDKLDYPKYHEDGLYEISKGCFTNKQGYKQFEDVLRKQLKNYGK